MQADDSVVTITAVLEDRPPRCGASRVVAIDGPSGSGKTDLADRLAAATNAAVLHLDDLYPGWHGLEATPPVVADLLAVIAGGDTGHARRWDWEHDRPGATLLLPPAPLVVVEGVGAAADVVRPFLSLVVWVEAPEAVRRERAIARDGDTYAPWWDVWSHQEREHHARELTRARADVVVST